ncbi:MAG: F0F1 ATP synthase subunit B [Candidatus Marinimicrobia bacterium]|jgi:F-type H+-transporting ATPase subunit b|nr:F0F1 ATP synthase subunit B [Candidatus Neomarinimicrobiota bacterium]MBT3632756.1 F0F1 ATP synthase subunit B [Candidatus Neomarinimicrobiota bacterium]MBT3681866.1 F0F1 ATP synthase subunit B [Candidatus Neomarinimicrobiota bacterium]MBT3760501.1 F0F1 ATP synthase subunit B [Candidatus Neomarinimicrobiota bacterium]MBT3896647.1 F0F1 ATP synthase subunit B [Candidatus Neomarinimicrobiota bacterium]
MKSIKNIVLILFLTGLSFASGGSGHSEATWMDNWLKPDPGIFLWTIVTFFIVLIILKAKAWGPLMDALDKREAEIKNSLAAAEKAKKEADAVSQEYDELVKKAQIEAQRIVSEGKSAGERVKVEIEKHAKLKADEMLLKAKEQIEAEKEKAVKEIKSVIVDLSISAASKVIEKNLDNQDNQRLIEATLKDIGRA